MEGGFINKKIYKLIIPSMGSSVHARQCKNLNEEIIGAIIFDTIGVFTRQGNNKRNTLLFLPSLFGLPFEADYIAFLSNTKSKNFVNHCAQLFSRRSSINLRTVLFPAISSLVAWSDDWSFWQSGFPAFTITDTAYLRSDHYHETTDTYEKLDYETMAELVLDIKSLISLLTVD